MMTCYNERGCERLAAAILAGAVKEAAWGNGAAAEFLGSDDARFWAAVAGIERKWDGERLVEGYQRMRKVKSCAQVV